MDPTGERVFRVWASAFIEPAKFIFVYPKAYTGLGEWHGDGRGFTNGQYNEINSKARVWHEIIFDADINSTAILKNTASVGTTYVDYLAPYPVPSVALPPSLQTDSARAPEPEIAHVNTDIPCIVMIDIKVDAPEGQNPLISGAPPIKYSYRLVFDLEEKVIWVSGSRGLFPWYELFIESEGAGVLAGQAPAYLNPALLALPARPMPELKVRIQ